jgi:hypothetical protein
MAVMLRTEAEVAAAWMAIDELYAQMPKNPRVAGARAAAEWTTGRIGTSPIMNVREPAVEPRAGWEGHEANMVVLGINQGDWSYAAGMMAWMFWWIGVEPLPRWLR